MRSFLCALSVFCFWICWVWTPESNTVCTAFSLSMETLSHLRVIFKNKMRAPGWLRWFKDLTLVFPLRSWFWDHEIEPWVRLYSGHGASLGFSLFLCLCLPFPPVLPCSCTCSLSENKYTDKKQDEMKWMKYKVLITKRELPKTPYQASQQVFEFKCCCFQNV